MKKAETYATVIQQINDGVEEFNRFLSPAYKFSLVSPGDPSTYTSALDQSWGEQRWPSKDDFGVYMLCGFKKDQPNMLGVYIGKASQQYIGHRLYAHLNPFRNAQQYEKNGFVIDVIFAIPVKDRNASSMASALEEYLIAKDIAGVERLNAIGVKG